MPCCRFRSASRGSTVKTMSLIDSDFLLHHAHEKKISVYATSPGIWFSNEIKRWMIVDPSLIETVMRSRDFSVSSYQVGDLGKRFGVSFENLDKIADRLPLAYEGERHKILRATFAKLISAQTPASIDAFRSAFQSNLDRCIAKAEFCLIEDLMRPSLRAALIALSRIELAADLAIEEIPQMFDDAISVRRRKAINDTIGQIFTASTLDEEQTYLSTALIAVIANTLLGSLSRSLIAHLEHAHGTQLSDIDWQKDFSHTALSLIEKRALSDVEIASQHIKKGDRLRLFFDAAGYVGHGSDPRYADLYFAVGPHRCIGMSLSRQFWTLMVDTLKSASARFNVQNVTYRTGDYVFVFPRQCLIHNSN